MESKINPGAVVAAAVAGWIVGMVWYSPLLFETQWMSLSGVTTLDLKAMAESGMAHVFILGFLCVFVMSYALAWLLKGTKPRDFLEAGATGFWVWAVITTVMTGGVLWEGKSPALLLLNSAHYLLVILVMCLIHTYSRENRRRS